jgi:hypothetical protein
MAQKNKLIIAVCALCLVVTIGSAFACAVTSGGFGFLIFHSETGSWNIDLGVTYFEEPRSFNVTVESQDKSGPLAGVYHLVIKGPVGFCNDHLTLKWSDSDGAHFLIGKDGDQSFSGIGTLTWNSNVPTVFEAEHKNNISLTLTFLTTAALGSYNAKMWVAFTEKVEAHVEIMPKVLNLKSRGQWVTAHISLPEPYKEEDIDVSSVKLWYKNSFVKAEWGKATKQFLMAKFSGDEVTEMLKSETGKVQLTVTGLVNGIEFSGTDTITVIKPGR